MYACICNAITEQQIQEALEDGAENLYDLQNKLGVGTQCGCCRDHTRGLVVKYQRITSKPSENAPQSPLEPAISI